MMGAAKPGYMLLLGLLLRPALIVLGFAFALTALEVVAQGFNGIFMPAFKIAMAGSVMGLGTGIVMLSIYFASMVWIFHTILGLIHIIPDKLLRWIGGGGEQLGESARGLSKAGESGSGAAARHADSVRQGAMTGMGQAIQTSSIKAGNRDSADRAAAGAEIQEKTSANNARVAMAKAETPGATADDSLKAVSESLNAADQVRASTAARRKADETSNKPNDQSKNASDADKSKEHVDEARSIVGKMTDKADQMKSNLASLPPAEQKAAANEVAGQYRAAAMGHEMLADQPGQGGKSPEGRSEEASRLNESANEMDNYVPTAGPPPGSEPNDDIKK